MKNTKLIQLFTASLILNSCIEKPNNSTNLKTTEANWDGCMLSAYIFQEDGRHYPSNALSLIDSFESLSNHEIGSVMWYPTFADNFPTKACRELINHNYIPHLTWELFFPDSVAYNTMPIDDNYDLMNQILNGIHDDYIEQFALDAKSLKSKIYIRFLHEFNGNWYLWSGNKNGAENGGPEKVVAVWKYIVDKFRSKGATNVKWVWNPHGPSIDINQDAWNNIDKYWPGDNYVDWIGMDAYNWYPKDPWGGKRPYRDFDNCFGELYKACQKLSEKPMMIAEFGSPEFEYDGTNKAAWITDAFDQIKNNYPKIKLILWFHINKELDWRINSSSSSLKAYQKAIDDPYFVGKSN